MIVFPVFPKVSKFFFSKIDDFLMKFANAIIIADESRIKQIGSNANKHIIVINNSPLDKNSHEINSELQNEMLVIFFGGVVQEDKGIANMILAVKDLQNVNLIIQGYCGSKDFENKIYLMCQDLPQVKLYLKRVPYEDILENTMKADLLFTLYDTKISNNIFASPNKLFEAMMFGKPIIVNEGTTMESIVRRLNCGLVVRYDNIDQIKEAIVKLKSDYSLRKKLGENGRKAYETIYSWKIMQKRLLQLYKLITN
jgi:glycosyltransferase involved in cell wall biosynthesis